MSARKVLAALSIGYAAAYLLGKHAGATPGERSMPLPGDDVVHEPLVLRTTHATTIAAPPERIWPWVVQMGWGRGGWYTARWVDELFFPANGPSADRIVPELQALHVGEWVPDGPPRSRTGFVVEFLEPNRHLVLHSTTHLPPGWSERFGAWIDWTWTFVLRPIDDDHTRFVFRCRGRVGPWWLALAYRLVITPADFVMSRQMIRGIKARAERSATTAVPAVTGCARR
jgi:hypothetical protein